VARIDFQLGTNGAQTYRNNFGLASVWFFFREADQYVVSCGDCEEGHLPTIRPDVPFSCGICRLMVHLYTFVRVFVADLQRIVDRSPMP
jgi:hypothetical protein